MTYQEPHYILEEVDNYLNSRTGTFEQHSVRYNIARRWLEDNGLTNKDTICDLGAGWTELDYLLRVESNWRGRYFPIDAGLSTVDLNYWTPERPVEYFTALEVLEHLHQPERLLPLLKEYCTKGVVITVPNPETVDVLGIDETHYSTPDIELFENHGYKVTVETFYGGHYSEGKPDGLLAVWSRN